MTERGEGFVASNLASMAAEIAALDAAPAPLVDQIVVDASAQGSPAVVSLRCGDEEFGWHEVPGGLAAVFQHVMTLTHEYGTRIVEVHGKHEAVDRWLVQPLKDYGHAVR
jgi:hypothetical protein